MKNKLIYSIDDIPPLAEVVPLGFQHYLTMFGSTVAIPLILKDHLGIGDDSLALALLISTMFFVSGITTLLQTTFGNRLPLIQGGSFSLLSPAMTVCAMAHLNSVGWEVRMQHLQGAIILGGIAEALIGYSGLVGRLLKFVGPITIAPTIALIGLALYQYGAPKAGLHWGLGGLTIGLIILFSQYLKNTHRAFELFPVMLGILLAWATAWALTKCGVFEAGSPAAVKSTGIREAAWFDVPMPFQWGLPKFGLAAFVGMFAGFMASIVESVGDYFACARLAGAPVPNKRSVSRGIGMEGIGCVIAGIFGTGNGTTSYSENIGAIGLTRVGSRRVVQVGALIMIVLACFGKFGAVFTTIPEPIVGGMYCAMFGMIASVGLSNLQFVDLNSARNLFIIGFAFYMGLSMPVYFAQHPLDFGENLRWLTDIGNTLGKTGMAVGALIAFTLDNTIPGTAAERGLTAWQTEDAGA